MENYEQHTLNAVVTKLWALCFKTHLYAKNKELSTTDKTQTSLQGTTQ